ncbi:MAG: hypothetical protein EXX96DRAFT_620662 [Benjaminiella poitrasii]|nr:MAG: hypothetical protein EXX96DRAFT_620662 [Benjaminiella poitrasii]
MSSVVSFDPNDSSKVKIIIIFVKKSAWKEAAEIAKNNNAASTAPYDLIYQIRQLQTCFHQQSTYFLCQASKETDNGNNNTDYCTASKLFQTIAINVIYGSPHLEKCTMYSLCSKLKAEGTAVYHILQSILTQFSDDNTFIDNEYLNYKLQKLTNLLAPAITRANQSVKQAVLKAYAR